MNISFQQASAQIERCCIQQPRYRVAWLTGAPLSGKTGLAQRLCETNGWQYLNYTLTPGYFDALAPIIATYQPYDLIAALQNWCAACTESVLVMDELDALLACWSFDQRRTWAGQVSRLAYLPCGLLLVTHLLDRSLLAPYLPDGDSRYCLVLSGENV